MQGPFFAVSDDLEPPPQLMSGWRLLIALVGGVLVLVAIPVSLLPGPGGFPLAIIGLILVLRNSIWARREFVKFKRANPRLGVPLRKLLRRDPEVIPVVWKQLLHAERILPRSMRFLVKWRYKKRKPNVRL